jgi:translocation and assembly module TamB
MTGQIVIRGGFLEVQGKKFEIEKGTITFVGDANNPILIVTAGWTAPDGTQVYADFVGPLETGKVTLRSEPSLPRNEILSLIVFGTQGGNQSPPPGQGPSGTTRAVGLGGGIATQGLNRAMDDLTGLDVTARVDTTDSANPRPELEFQLAKNISLQIGYVLGVPPPGENPDKTLLTLDWRFFKNLSVETTVGDRGSSILDLIWRKRY